MYTEEQKKQLIEQFTKLLELDVDETMERQLKIVEHNFRVLFDKYRLDTMEEIRERFHRIASRDLGALLQEQKRDMNKLTI